MHRVIWLDALGQEPARGSERSRSWKLIHPLDSRWKANALRDYPPFFALPSRLRRPSKPCLNLSSEFIETKRSRPSIRPEIVAHDRHFAAEMHPQNAAQDLAFRLRHARKLSRMFRPGANQHFSAECSRVFQVLVHVEQESAIP